MTPIVLILLAYAATESPPISTAHVGFATMTACQTAARGVEADAARHKWVVVARCVGTGVGR